MVAKGKSLDTIVADFRKALDQIRLDAVLALRDYQFTSMGEERKAVDGIVRLFDDPYAEIARQAVYCVQQWIKKGYLQSPSLRRKCLKHIAEAINGRHFNINNGAFMNSVAITIREFEDKSVLPYLLENMASIGRGWGSPRVKRCWSKTFKVLIDLPDVRGTVIDIDMAKSKAEMIVGMNIFGEQLVASCEQEKSEALNRFYCSYFKGIKEIIDRTEDRNMQRRGIDKTLVSMTGEETHIEEKGRSAQYWDKRKEDILIEVVSVDINNIPGWIYTCEADYLAYYFEEPGGRHLAVYLLPFASWLKPWWSKHEKKYSNKPIVSAPNPGYNTLSKAIAIEDIKNALAMAGMEKCAKLHIVKLDRGK